MMSEFIKACLKSEESICKKCLNHIGFNGEYWNCRCYQEVRVKYENDGSVFHTKIIECDHFKEGIL